MAAYDLEDEDELETADTLSSMPGGVPNVPRDPDAPPMDRTARMKQYLQSQGMSPEERGDIRDLRKSSGDLALMRALMQSANQVGTLGGKQASSAPFDQLTQSLQGQNQAMIGDIQSEAQRRDKMRQYLEDKMAKEEQASALLKEKRLGRESREGHQKNMEEIEKEKLAIERAKPAKEKEPTEGERKFGAFANRAESANNAYEAYIKENPAAAQLSMKDALIGKYGGEFGSVAMSPESKMAKQLEKEFIGSVLRPETGAAASDDEWSMYGAKYFPRQGDTPEMLARKAEIRKQDIGTMRTIAGRGASPLSSVAQSTGMQAPRPAENPANTSNTSTMGTVGANKSAPPVGTVRGRFKFMGGDPKDRNSWQEVTP